MAESINTEESWNTFLKDYRKGTLVDVARERIQKLKDRDSEPKIAVTEAVPKPPVLADTVLIKSEFS
jgi:hypothetical protein